jgi:hypothetical protein
MTKALFSKASFFRSLVVAIDCVAIILYQFVPLSGFEVFANHLGDEFLKGDPRRPAEFLPGLGLYEGQSPYC